MNAPQIAAVALEFWRTSGPRTWTRLEALVLRTIESYYGPEGTWPPIVQEDVLRVQAVARGFVRAWEVNA